MMKSQEMKRLAATLRTIATRLEAAGAAKLARTIRRRKASQRLRRAA